MHCSSSSRFTYKIDVFTVEANMLGMIIDLNHIFHPLCKYRSARIAEGGKLTHCFFLNADCLTCQSCSTLLKKFIYLPPTGTWNRPDKLAYSLTCCSQPL